MTQAPGLSTIQAAVQIVQNIAQCGMTGEAYVTNVSDLHALMSDWALKSAKDAGDIPTDMTLTAALLGDDPSAEGEPATAAAYWRETGTFFRKVFQACAAAA